MPVLVEAIQKYYDKLDMHFDAGDILITDGGSEALQIAFNCILDDGDEVLIPEPFYPNYNTMVRTCGASIHPIPTSPHEGYRYADRARWRRRSTSIPGPSYAPTPATPPAWC